MELKLEVVLSSSIKRKKPWPHFCWLGLEKESVFLLDYKRISEVNMVTGRTKKKTPKLHPLLPRVVTMAAAQNGVWLAGLLLSGELFLWNRDKDSLKSVAAAPDVTQLVTAAQGHGRRLYLQVSGNGMHVLLASVTGQVFLWECVDARDLMGPRDVTARGHWALLRPSEHTALPAAPDKEASLHSIFIKTEAMGDVCLSAFVFTAEEKLTVTFLKIQWEESQDSRAGSVGYRVRWASKTFPMSGLSPPCRPVRSRGALVPAFSPDGLLLAIVLNQKDPRATQVLFVSTHNFVSVSSDLGGCGSKRLNIPSKYIRSYWVGSVSWAAGGLLLACVLKRGSLLMLARLGGLLSLSTSGCNMDFGPAHFLPLHPLVTYRPPVSAGQADASLSSSSVSARDVLRQRYSVTWHPRLFYFIVSDGYMATVLRVPERPSPARLLRALLQETTQGLEKASCILGNTQVHARAWLESVSCLKPSSSLEELRPQPTASPPPPDGSSLPLFLQDQGTLGDTRELLHKVQALFEDDSDLEGPPAGSHVQDGGRLEFACMFDTIHAKSDSRTGPGPEPDPTSSDSVSSERKPPSVLPELRRVQGSLLTAWALGMSAGGAMEHRESLLKHIIRCAVRFTALLRLSPGPKARTGRKRSVCFSSRLLRLLRALLSFLPWDATRSGGQSCLGLVVELSQQLVHLLLSSPPEPYHSGQPSCQLSSQSLSVALLVLRLTSDSLDHSYGLQQRAAWASQTPERPAQLLHSDVYSVPLLQEDQAGRSGLEQTLPGPQRPSSRLLAVWRGLYRLTLQYAEQLRGLRSWEGCEEELGQVSDILTHIQTAIQGTGDRLEEGSALISYPGEHHFLLGWYSESAEAWRSELQAESRRGGARSVFQQTRLCLAMLYGLLSQYQLREAQGLADHMARLVPHNAGHQNHNINATSESVSGSSLPVTLHSEAACAVVQSLGRFMASYFTNQPLYILPPHSVDVLPPLHLPHGPGVGRVVGLCQERVSGAVRGQQLSGVWTVGYALDLLLLGGLLPEAVWLAHRLGDWKTAASLGLAYTSYCSQHWDFTRLRWRELHLPASLEPESLFQVQFEALLGRKASSQEPGGEEDDYKSFTDSLEGEDVKLFQASLQEILKASVMSGVDVMSEPLSALLTSAKELSSSLSALVPSGLYLPAPPLYCPQPAANTQDPTASAGPPAEELLRHRVSGALQRLLLLLQSARCARPTAQWYLNQLRRAKHLLYKIKQKYSHLSATEGEEEERSFPDGLMKFLSRGGFFTLGPNRDGHLDPVSTQTIMCFRELCALCWMLHVRDQLSVCCRKYQAARHLTVQASADCDLRCSCEEAVLWARRLLPFSHFLNAEELLQDTLLSLLSELPPSTLVAESVVRTFPEEEECVRVPLREKYTSLLNRLRPCSVPGGGGEDQAETMAALIRDKRRQRRKHLRRLERHLGAPELFLWEREEDEDRGVGGGGQWPGAVPGHPSLGASLSSTLYSDGDTTENMSEAPLSPGPQIRPTTSKRAPDGAADGRTAVQTDTMIREEPGSGPDRRSDPDQPSLPVVGTWEFELEDEEYLRFLELFLSYVLERDGADGGDPGRDPPLLRGFCSQLRERELHSLSFDVLTTLRRRQRDGRHAAARRQGAIDAKSDAPVFRAGHCYNQVQEGSTPEPSPSLVRSEAPISRASLSVTSLPGLTSGKQQGLFGLRRQAGHAPGPGAKAGHWGSDPSPVQSSFLWEHPSESRAFGSLVSTEVELQHGLDAGLEARFPELGRLLEWMVRWADKRVLLAHPSRRKEKERGVAGGGGVVMRVKASAPAVLTALCMLEHRYTGALLGTDQYGAQPQAPGRQWTVAPVLQPEVTPCLSTVGWRLERESSLGTDHPASVLPDPHTQSCGSHTEGAEEETSQRRTQPCNQEPAAFQSEITPGSRSLSPQNQLGLISDKEDICPRSQYSLSDGTISEQICSLDLALSLVDLQCSDRDGDVFSRDTSQVPCEPADPEAAPQPQHPPEENTLLSAPTQVQLHRAAGAASPHLQPQSSIPAYIATATQNSIPATPNSIPTTTATQNSIPTTTATQNSIPATQNSIPTTTATQNSIPATQNSIPTTTATQNSIPTTTATQNSIPATQNSIPTTTATQSSMANITSTTAGQSGIGTTGGTPAVSTAPTQPQTIQTDPVRQLLNDELFRLVQLQQVNFMSLMQVVGASFSNLPVIHQNPLLAQSNMNTSHLNLPPSHASNVLSHHMPGPNPVSISTAPARHSDQPPTARPPHSLCNRAEMDSQEMQPVYFHAEPTGSPRRERERKLIPSTQGLLTTVELAPPTAPLVPTSSGNTRDVPAPQYTGLKLIQLHPPPLPFHRPTYPSPVPVPVHVPVSVRDAWGPQPGPSGPPHLNLNQYDPDALRRAEEEERKRRGTAGEVPLKHLNLALYANPQPTARTAPRSNNQPQPPAQNPEARVERSRGPMESPLLPQTPTQGLRLIHLHPEPHSTTAFPRLPAPPLTVIPVPIGSTSRIQLLHLDPEPRIVRPVAAPPTPVTRLLPPEELSGWAVGRQRAGEAGIQVLRVDHPLTPNTGQTTASTSSYCNKRQKRREERMRRDGERVEVTFRPNDSIIPPQQPTDEPVSETPTDTGTGLGPGQSLAVPPGSFESLLTGQRLLDQAFSTAAELHLFASSCKRPPESHDACTNTEPASPDSHVDKALSAQTPEARCSAAVLPPDVFVNLRFPREPPVRDTEGQQESERNLDMGGREFLHVIDLEDGALLEELSVAVRDVPARQPSPPTSAQLHLMAASVTNAASTALYHSSITAEDSLPSVTQPDLSQEAPPRGQPEFSGDPVTVTLLQDGPGPSGVHGTLEAWSLEPRGTFSSQAPGAQISARLSEMDAQLAALQSIADHMEMEFANSRLLVNTIETLTPAVAPVAVERRPALHKAVSLLVPQRAAGRCQSHSVIKPKTLREEEEEFDVHVVSSGLLSPPSAANQRPCSSRRHSPSGMKVKMAEAHGTSGTSGICAEDSLGVSGLSDVADILGELMKDGALSPSDLGLSHTQAARINSRLDHQQQQRGEALQREVCLEEEHRRDVRIWMRGKQRETQAEYRRQIDGLRGREFRPYSTSAPSKQTYKDRATMKKNREERNKVLLQQYNQRTSEACALLSDLLTAPLALPCPSRPLGATYSSRPLDAPPSSLRQDDIYRARSLSASGRRISTRTLAGQPRSLSCPRDRPGRQGLPLAVENRHERLGLNRPVSSLPRNRLSQVTRRGMLTDLNTRRKAKAGSRPHNPPRDEPGNKSVERKMGWNKSSSGKSSGGGGEMKQRERGEEEEDEEEEDEEEEEEEEEKEREVRSPWDPPSEIRRLLDMEESDPGLGVSGLSGGQVKDRGMDWLEDLTESSGSILSKLDWAAIESMAAGEGSCCS